LIHIQILLEMVQCKQMIM